MRWKSPRTPDGRARGDATLPSLHRDPRSSPGGPSGGSAARSLRCVAQTRRASCARIQEKRVEQSEASLLDRYGVRGIDDRIACPYAAQRAVGTSAWAAASPWERRERTCREVCGRHVNISIPRDSLPSPSRLHPAPTAREYYAASLMQTLYETEATQPELHANAVPSVRDLRLCAQPYESATP